MITTVMSIKRYLAMAYEIRPAKMISKKSWGNASADSRYAPRKCKRPAVYANANEVRTYLN